MTTFFVCQVTMPAFPSIVVRINGDRPPAQEDPRSISEILSAAKLKNFQTTGLLPWHAHPDLQTMARVEHIARKLAAQKHSKEVANRGDTSVLVATIEVPG